MASPRETLEHLLACCDAMYRGLGECAPRLSNDGYVVAVYEMGRSFGSLALAMREFLGADDVKPLAVILEVLDRAWRADESGAMTLYAVAHVLGPRLLVSLRDAREAVAEEPAVAALVERASGVCLDQVLKVAAVAKDQPEIDDPEWQHEAKGLVATVESSGNAESFGISH
ncbi:MAG: hypothetical protein ABSC34_04545 [Acidimicrobiales bacterium]